MASTEKADVLDGYEGGEAAESMDPMQKRLFELRMKLNAGRKANKQHVIEEHKRNVDPNYAKKQKAQETRSERDAKRKNAESKDTSLTDTVEEAAAKCKKIRKKQKHVASFGWDVFNQDALYNAYKKRLEKLPGGLAEEDDDEEDVQDKEFNYGRNDKVTEDGVNRMVEELEERARARKKFSRRRQHYEGEDVDYINDRNRHFNKKISRAFDKYTVEIRQNLERGTAL